MVVNGQSLKLSSCLFKLPHDVCLNDLCTWTVYFFLFYKPGLYTDYVEIEID